jgi:hypothetical protein
MTTDEVYYMRLVFVVGTIENVIDYEWCTRCWFDQIIIHDSAKMGFRLLGGSGAD